MPATRSLAKTDRRWIGVLFALALVLRTATALAMTHPGLVMDAYYYLNGGLSLRRGLGFQDPYIWNYLGDPADIPHPGHLYWMPLSSLLVAGSMALFGESLLAAQIPFILLSSLLVPLSYVVGRAVGGERRHAVCAALLTIFSGFYAAYWVTTDNFAPFALVGAGCLWSLGLGLETGRRRWFALAGICAGLAHLARSDGLLFVVVAVGLGLWQSVTHLVKTKAQRPSAATSERIGPAIACLVFALCYLLAMLPWFVRNVRVSGAPIAPGGASTLWLTDYDDLYSFGKELSPRTFISWGWADIIRSKLQGLWLNLQTLLVVGWMIALAPFGLLGVWRLRRRARFAPAWLYGLALYLSMSLAFTLPGWRGAMLHSSVALLPFLLAAAMEGLDAALGWVSARRRRWRLPQARRVFSVGMVGIVGALSVFLCFQALPRYRGVHPYVPVAEWMEAHIPQDARVMVNDPAAFYYYSQRQCLALPSNDVDTLFRVADRYDAQYLLVDKNAPVPLQALYDQPGADPRLRVVQRFVDADGDPMIVYQIGAS